MSDARRPRLSVWFEAPRRVRVRPGPEPEPGPGELRVRTRVSAISVGTELAAYRGQLDPALGRDETLGALAEGGFGYPFQYGYASAGVVDRSGPEIPEGAPGVGERVFAFTPHESAFCAPAGELLRVPVGISDERAALFPYLETAVNLLLDGVPRIGERVAVVGQGMLGLALLSLLSRFPLGGLWTVEPSPARRERSLAFGAARSVPPAEAAEAVRQESGGAGAELVFEVSGTGAGLDLAVGLAAREGRVIAGSWLAGGPTSLDLGSWFHRGRIRIRSSQVSRLPPLEPSWSVGRRREFAWSLLRSVPLDGLVTHRWPLSEAAAAYARLDGGGALGALLLSGGVETASDGAEGGTATGSGSTAAS